jgi:dUTP pyrophosphatase
VIGGHRRGLTPFDYCRANLVSAFPQVDQLSVRLLHPAARPPARTRPGDARPRPRVRGAFGLAPGERATVGTGVAVALPEGVAGLVVPRSGLAARHGISVVNGPGLFDPNYGCEIKVVLVNLGGEPFAAAAGDRIAQLLLVPFAALRSRWVDELAPFGDDRGDVRVRVLRRLTAQTDESGARHGSNP